MKEDKLGLRVNAVLKMSWLPAPRGGPRIILGCTGSVAAIKVPELARRLKERGASVIIVPTERACHFLRCQAKVDPVATQRPLRVGGASAFKPVAKSMGNGEKSNDTSEINITSSEICSHCGSRTPAKVLRPMDLDKSAFKSLYPDLNFVLDEDEWSAWQGRGDSVLHIQLREWAQVLVIAPLDANTMAKMAQGLCDNLLTCIVRAWDVSRPLVFCPAMNTHMYSHPLTMKHTAILKELGYIEVCVISKRLACGDVGLGAMAEVDNIVDAVMQELPGEHRVSHGPF